jgi:cyanophycin synthetase
MIATEIAKDKSLAYRILSDLGLPVPKQSVVYSLKRALTAAEKIGYPVVLKPLDGNHGRGVTVNVTSARWSRRPTTRPRSTATRSSSSR